MKCLQCGGETRVTTTYQNADRTTKRRRQCIDEKCGYRFTTRERPDSVEREEVHERQVDGVLERRFRSTED